MNPFEIKYDNAKQLRQLIDIIPIGQHANFQTIHPTVHMTWEIVSKTLFPPQLL